MNITISIARWYMTKVPNTTKLRLPFAIQLTIIINQSVKKIVQKDATPGAAETQRQIFMIFTSL